MGSYRKLSWTDADVRCPFYIDDDRKARTITCEGIEGCETTKLKFRNLDERDKYMGRNCVTHCGQCELYKIINKKYD